MGWEDYHLYEFRIGRTIAYGVPDPDWDFPGSSPRPANKATLADLLAQTRNKTFKLGFGRACRQGRRYLLRRRSLTERGIERNELINGAQPVGRQAVAEFVGRYGRVWYW